jgi:hypothetical protein
MHPLQNSDLADRRSGGLERENLTRVAAGTPRFEFDFCQGWHSRNCRICRPATDSLPHSAALKSARGPRFAARLRHSNSSAKVDKEIHAMLVLIRGRNDKVVFPSLEQEIDVQPGPRGVDRWFSKPVNPQQQISALREDMHSQFLSM